MGALTRDLLGVALVLNYLAAAATTAHAVMYKRDPRSAAGWALASFTIPLLGPLAYWFMGVNRIRRRQIEDLSPAGPPADPGRREEAAVEERLAAIGAPQLTDLVQLARRITGRPLLAGNAIEPLADGEEAYPAMLEAIRGARRSVSLETYIFIPDDAGREFIAALADAARRGVEVRVLIDGFGERYSWARARPQLRRSGVRCAKFIPPIPLWRGAYLNLRNHRKVLVVDGRTGFTGGMNLSSRNYTTREDNPRRQHDLHFRLRGPIVAEMERTFIDDWWFVTREKLEGSASAPPADAGTALCRAVVDGPDQDHENIRNILLGAIACAQRRVQIMTPYFIPDRETISGLVTTALRGVQVDLIVPGRSNLPFFQWAMVAFLWEVLRFGVRVFFQPPPFVHSKVLVVDGTWVLLGSSNLDPRSLRLNFEFDVEAYDPALAARLAADLDAAAARSRPVTLEEVDARTLPLRLRDGVAKLISPYL
jgi:cardiolipin synthase A/B